MPQRTFPDTGAQSMSALKPSEPKNSEDYKHNYITNNP